MGWTSYNASFYKNGRVDRLSECRAEFGKDSKWATIVKDAMVGSTYYAAMRLSKNGEIFGLVVLTSVSKNIWSDEFYYKEMDETGCPCQIDCPINILKLLSPTNNESALQWRAKCYDNAAKNKLLKSANKIEVTLPENFNSRFYSGNEKILLSKYNKMWVDWNKRVAFRKRDFINYAFVNVE